MLATFAQLALIAALAFSDAFTGGGFGWNKLTVDHGGPLHGRGSYYVALPLLALGYLAYGLAGLELMVIWLIYRSAFGFPSDTITGKRLRATIIRHLLPIMGVIFVAAANHLSLLIVTPFVAYAAGATWLAVNYGAACDAAAAEARAAPSLNPTEAARGALFGVAVLAALRLVANG